MFKTTFEFLREPCYWNLSKKVRKRLMKKIEIEKDEQKEKKSYDEIAIWNGKCRKAGGYAKPAGGAGCGNPGFARVGQRNSGGEGGWSHASGKCQDEGACLL